MDRHDKQNLGDSQSFIIHYTGLIKKLNTDNAPKMVERTTHFFKHAWKEGVDITTIEPNHPDEKLR